MNNSGYILNERFEQIETQVRQPLLTWSQHVCSWVDQTVFPVHVMRYEDMHQQPQAAFAAAFGFMGFQDDPDRLSRALEFSNFRVLQEQEQAHGFRERTPKSQSAFFRQGETGGWRKTLTSEQAGEIVSAHAIVMRRFGYLSETGEILC
jgi:hypothetical protein